MAHFYNYNKKVRDKYLQSEFRALGEVVKSYCEQRNLRQCVNTLSGRNSIAWFYLCEDDDSLRPMCFISTYRHLGFGNATTPSIVIDKLGKRLKNGLPQGK